MAADPITSALASQLGILIQDQIKKNIKFVVNVDQEIEKLKYTLISIQTVILDADNKQVNENSIKLWLERLQGVCYNLDDVLAEWSMALLKIERKNNNRRLRVFFSCGKAPYFSIGRIMKRRDIALKIKDLHQKLSEIHLERQNYTLNGNDDSSSSYRVGSVSSRPSTHSFIEKSTIKGRDKENTILVNALLLKDGGEGLNIVSVIGMGGIGKTTLAQLAYNSDEVKVQFEMRFWIGFSQPFDLVRIAKAIIENFDWNRSKELFELDAILNLLREKIQEKRFLVVLDDVWTYDLEDWEPLISLLGVGALGSTLLVTTRNEKVAKIIRCRETIQLELLSNEDCWELFSEYAFINRRDEELKHLKPIGRDIVYKCKGVPLVVKTIGSMMIFKKTVEEWQNVLNSHIWDLEEPYKAKILPPLLLSYQALEEYAWRRCFRYCAIFPKDSKIDAEIFIKLWMANGYLIPKGDENMEAIGREYLDNLAMRCLIQVLKRDGNTIVLFKMHDLIHDLAQYLSKNECTMMEVVDGKLPRTEFRHLTLMITDYVSIQSTRGGATTKLHTLRLRSPFFDTGIQKLLNDLFNNLLHLKVLDISHSALREVPMNIHKLFNLRYLSFYGNLWLRELPETVCELYNLQTLNVNGCELLTELPEGMDKLENLRHLQIPIKGHLNKLPRGIGKLNSLQTLNKVVLSNIDKTFNLGDLMVLKHLRGNLRIKGLSYTNVADARKAGLKEKPHLVDLEMIFKPISSPSSPEITLLTTPSEEEEVAEALEVHPNVTDLTMGSYRGTQFPNWITSLENLCALRLTKCKNCTVLPPLGKLQSCSICG